LNISGARIAMFRKCPPLACANWVQQSPTEKRRNA
jgi:hypothetical protein